MDIKLIQFVESLNVEYEKGKHAIAILCDNEDQAEEIMNKAKDNDFKSGVVKYLKKKVKICVQC